ncbi:MAG: hypothetical protein KatS3mg126_1323 [Lysobacteraceae bacterium]|nr:MAG: hypothetical protein KatS3mg126_1323 [Xanthomonadaceae bacterium]
MQPRMLPWLTCLLALAPTAQATQETGPVLPEVRLDLSRSHGFQRPKNLVPGASLKPQLPAPLPNPVVLSVRAHAAKDGAPELECEAETGPQVHHTQVQDGEARR